MVVRDDALDDLGDLGEHRPHVEGARQGREQRLQGLALSPALVAQALELGVLDGERGEVDDGLERFGQ